MDYRGQSSLPRGIRNNNPGNEEVEIGVVWQGQVGTDANFVIFADTTWGLRALAKDLTTKITVDGLTTISQIITDYAPPSENDTASYIASVASDTGFGANDILTADPDTLAALVRAIVNHENGDGPSSQYVSDADIQTGVQMASNPATVFQQG
jgi:hypothetical protein